MINLKNKKIIIIVLLVTILVICSFIYIFKDINKSDNKGNINILNYNLELKEELLTLMKVELSTSWHRYDNWEEKIDNNPYIVCSGRDRLVASINHDDYGDIYFLFYKVDSRYYVKDYGNKIIDWEKSCEY